MIWLSVINDENGHYHSHFVLAKNVGQITSIILPHRRNHFQGAFIDLVFFAYQTSRRLVLTIKFPSRDKKSLGEKNRKNVNISFQNKWLYSSLHLLSYALIYHKMLMNGKKSSTYFSSNSLHMTECCLETWQGKISSREK